MDEVLETMINGCKTLVEDKHDAPPPDTFIEVTERK